MCVWGNVGEAVIFSGNKYGLGHACLPSSYYYRSPYTIYTFLYAVLPQFSTTYYHGVSGTFIHLLPMRQGDAFPPGVQCFAR